MSLLSEALRFDGGQQFRVLRPRQHAVLVYAIHTDNKSEARSVLVLGGFAEVVADGLHRCLAAVASYVVVLSMFSASTGISAASSGIFGPAVGDGLYRGGCAVSSLCGLVAAIWYTSYTILLLRLFYRKDNLSKVDSIQNLGLAIP